MVSQNQISDSKQAMIKKKAALEEIRNRYRAQNGSKKLESAVMKTFKNIGDGMVSLVTEPQSLIDILKRKRDAYRYNKAKTAQLMARREAYRLGRLGFTIPVKSHGFSYRYGRQNERPIPVRANPALVRFMAGRQLIR